MQTQLGIKLDKYMYIKFLNEFGHAVPLTSNSQHNYEDVSWFCCQGKSFLCSSLECLKAIVKAIQNMTK